MRILMVTRGVVPIGPGCGGAELAAYQLSRALASEGQRVVLVADVGASEPLPPGLVFHELRSRLLPRLHRLPSGFFRWIVEHLVGNLSRHARHARSFAATRTSTSFMSTGTWRRCCSCGGPACRSSTRRTTPPRGCAGTGTGGSG